MCKKHPKYKAVRKPRVNCEECWRMYFDNRNKPKIEYKISNSRIDNNTFPYLY